MVKLTHLLNKKIIIARFATISGDKMAFSTVTAQMMHIQPISDDKSPIDDGVFGKSFTVYTEGSADLQDGDRLRDNATGDTYTVVSGGTTRRTFGCIDFLQVVVQKTK